MIPDSNNVTVGAERDAPGTDWSRRLQLRCVMRLPTRHFNSSITY